MKLSEAVGKRVETTEDIATQDYILTPGRYVGIEDKEEDDEPFDEKMTRLTSELSQMFAKSHELEEEIRKKLTADMASALSVSAKITLVSPGTVARSEGKAKRITDRRKL